MWGGNTRLGLAARELFSRLPQISISSFPAPFYGHISTHFRRLLSSIMHLMPSIVQFEHVTLPSALTWYRCITSQRTLRERQAAQALAALLLTGFGLPSLSTPDVDERFLEPESTDPGECGDSPS
jgi:hypothetical protein